MSVFYNFSSVWLNSFICFCWSASFEFMESIICWYFSSRSRNSLFRLSNSAKVASLD